MIINKIVLGEYENNSYTVRRDEISTDCIVIDTGLNAEPLINFLKKNNLNPHALILTHGHIDHIAGIDAMRQNFDNIKVCIHRDDASMLTDARENLSASFGFAMSFAPADIIFDTQKEINFANLKFQIIHTPGHTKGGICLYNRDEKILFSGDTLFAQSVGRTDFAGKNAQKCFEQLIDNIKNKLLILPDDTAVLPGHGPETTIGKEKLYNPYLQ